MAVSIPPAITSPQHRTPERTPPQHTIKNVVLGKLRMTPQYSSFYPEDLIGGRKAPLLYVCQWCFRYTNELMKYAAHCKACSMRDEPPPGDVIYEKDGFAIHRVDGEEYKLYAQNLSLFAKLFLDTKSVFFDVSAFLYYILVQQPSSSPPPNATHATTSTFPSSPHGQVLGFFSKEKMSWDNNNLACILIFPPFQRRGLGQMLIGASYELGRREGRFGGPEKPLSEAGKKGYLAFWSGEIARYLLGMGTGSVDVKAISEATWILPEDVVSALREMGVVEGRGKGGSGLVVEKEKVREWVVRHGVRLEPVVDPEAFLEEESVDGSEEREVGDSEAES